jgi:Pyrimidine dimer DNA glycosylase
MQTFMPEKTFDRVAQVLDNKRLVKQLLEGRQIMSALSGESKGWINHPATKMWQGAELTLFAYLMCIAREMNSRGYKTETNFKEIERMYFQYFDSAEKSMIRPTWMADQLQFHKVVTTHRRALYLKDPVHYAQYEQYVDFAESNVCCDRCNYHWPTHLK